MSDIQSLLSQLHGNHITRRQFINRAVGLGLSATAASSLAAASSVPALASAQDTSDREPTSVTIWTWRDQDEQVWQAAAEALQESWPGLEVEVDVSDATEFETRVLTAMQGGQGPDIITTRAGDSYFRPYAEAGMFVPLTDQVPGLADIPEGTLGQVSIDGEVLAVPFASQIWMFYYNTQIFDDLGLTPPETWSELMGMCETISSETDIAPLFVPAREGWVLSGYVDCIGATYLGNDYAGQLISGEQTFTDERFVNLLTRIKDLEPCFQEGFVGNDTTDMDAAFQSGRAAMILYGGWAASTYSEQNPDLEFDFFLCPPDEAGGEQFSYVFVDGGYAVNAASEVQEAAMELVRYSATVDYGQTFSDITQEMSSIPGVTATEENVYLQRQLEYSELAIQNLFRIRSVFDAGDPGISTLMHPLMQGVVSDQLSPEDAAQQIQEGLAQWYEPFGGEQD